MGLTMLRIDRSKIRWRAKLEGAFDKQAEDKLAPLAKKEAKGGKWTLFLIPLITVLREGLEAVVFVGGVSLFLFPSKVFRLVLTLRVAMLRFRLDNLQRLSPSPPSLESSPVSSSDVSSF